MADVDSNQSRNSQRDRRRAPRAPVVVRVDYSTVDDFFSEFTQNVNEGGLFIETESPAPLDAQVHLQFQLPGSEEPIKATGRVVRVVGPGESEPSGMGVEFEDLDDTARRRINALVQRLRVRPSTD